MNCPDSTGISSIIVWQPANKKGQSISYRSPTKHLMAGMITPLPDLLGKSSSWNILIWIAAISWFEIACSIWNCYLQRGWGLAFCWMMHKYKDNRAAGSLIVTLLGPLLLLALALHNTNNQSLNKNIFIVTCTSHGHGHITVTITDRSFPFLRLKIFYQSFFSITFHMTKTAWKVLSISTYSNTAHSDMLCITK